MLCVISLSLSLSPKKELERERGGTRAANTHEKSFGRANVACQKPRAVKRVCKMSKGQCSTKMRCENYVQKPQQTKQQEREKEKKFKRANKAKEYF